MSEITLKGNKIHTSGSLPSKGSEAKDFELTTPELGTKSLEDFKGKKLVLNIFPSVDTGVCAQSVRTFNEKAAQMDNTSVLCISRDLPFAQNRFCAAEGIENVEMLSDFNTGKFGEDYGVTITDGPMKGLHSRAVVVLDENHKVVHAEQVPEITEEPDYEAAINSFS
ncbi:thiol peroxidase [Weeksellaceae bacterium KMM 9724]|uniref:thiol peroxidase n=1 Tax=Profundicola chukchiensis TaxID=2961959 RepID=UPI00243AEFCE|nr:thiol peroxidase [Profundicola chukchiensis]MDG4951257.1 thiol peroxidase [Profundicola chukchiensis]